MVGTTGIRERVIALLEQAKAEHNSDRASEEVKATDGRDDDLDDVIAITIEVRRKR